MIVIIDYSLGNTGSILNMLKRVGAEAVISSDPEVISRADKLVLPGVGAFDQGMAHLSDLGFISVLNEKVINLRTPVLGICLGMQLMTRNSEEGLSPGLGWINGRTVRFRHELNTSFKVPHMGWNKVVPQKESALLNGLGDDPRFYFVHSYHVFCEEQVDILAVTSYGYEFVSAFRHGNVFGVQFHPEKSHKYGMKLLENFVEYS